MLIWFAFMSSVEHKEERFLFVVYPLIAFAGACALLSIEDLLTSIGSFVRCHIFSFWHLKVIQERKVRSFAKVLTTLVIIVVCVLSVSRGLALYNNYSAPMKLYNHISTLKPCGSEQVNVCVGKEWYRFSSEYFFPNDHFNLTFVHDGPQSQVCYLPIFSNSIKASSILPVYRSWNTRQLQWPKRGWRVPLCMKCLGNYLTSLPDRHR